MFSLIFFFLKKKRTKSGPRKQHVIEFAKADWRADKFAWVFLANCVALVLFLSFQSWPQQQPAVASAFFNVFNVKFGVVSELEILFLFCFSATFKACI
jgi:hypothetical protein